MHKHVLLTVVALAAAGAFALGVHAEAPKPLRFAVENDSGQALVALTISRNHGQDRRLATLDHTPLASGDSAAVRVDVPDPQCDYNVRAEYKGGVFADHDGTNLCELPSNTLVLND